MSTRYTFAYGYQAHTVTGQCVPGAEAVIIPDQVADDQCRYDGETFPVIYARSRRRARATLRGDLYGLHTPGTGNPVVAIC